MSKSTTPKKKYTYVTKALTLPDGSRKFIRAATQEELDEKVMKELILINAGVDISSRETFGHFAQMWYELYKEPLLRSHSKKALRAHRERSQHFLSGALEVQNFKAIKSAATHKAGRGKRQSEKEYVA